MGLRAWAPDLPGLFAEAARALADISADDAARTFGATAAQATSDVALVAPDLVGLAFAWLNELIGLADVHGPLADATVDSVAKDVAGWRLHGRATFAAAARPRIGVKSATYHRLEVERTKDEWSLSAVLDV